MPTAAASTLPPMWDWHEKQRLLKTAFEVDIRSTRATYDIQYGHVERPTHMNNSWDWAKFEVVGHKWADLSENGYGVSLLNDCKYGYNIRENVDELSLLKSSKYPDQGIRYGRAHLHLCHPAPCWFCHRE